LCVPSMPLLRTPLPRVAMSMDDLGALRRWGGQADGHEVSKRVGTAVTPRGRMLRAAPLPTRRVVYAGRMNKTLRRGVLK
jgi:hypothetical protein